jgi:hypothetical protein
MISRAAAVVAALAATSCELTYEVGHSRVPSLPGPSSSSTELDILVVMDNSASMAGKQDHFVRSLFKPECPISDLRDIPQALRDEAPSLTDVCGFLQIIAAEGKDFRLGFITSDVDDCDNVVPDVQGTARVKHLQRGCLQRVPGTATTFLSRDVVPFEDDLVRLVQDIGTFGTPYTRPFDATAAFLDADTASDSCADDRATFLSRAEADLLVVFVSDKDDCSHPAKTPGLPDAIAGCPKTPAETPGADVLFSNGNDPAHCTSVPGGPLAKTAALIAGERKAPAKTSVVVVAGAQFDINGELRPSGCLLSTGGFPIEACWDSDDIEHLAAHSCEPPFRLPPGESPLPCCDAHFPPHLFALSALAPFTPASICADDEVTQLLAALP